MTKALLLHVLVFCGIAVSAQQLAPDQNPDFAVSRSKYMFISDSLNRTQSTTSQQTYKAIDYMADREEARQERRNFRRDLRMERARRNYFYNGWGTQYYRPFGRFNRSFYSPYYGFNNALIWGGANAPLYWGW